MDSNALPPLSCTLLYQSTSPHLQQLYTGFLMLHKQGSIRLAQRRRRDEVRYDTDALHLRGAGHAHLDAILDDSIRIHFDTHDSMEIATKELDGCDVYFKRSYSPPFVDSLAEAQRKKIFPLGLNYRVLPDEIDPFAIERGIRLGKGLKAKLSACRQALDTANLLRHEPRVSSLAATPDLDAEPRVLFLVAAYDPYEDEDRSDEKIADRIQVNETRARCIEMLSNALGARFTGGFTPSAFARKHYAGLTAPIDTTAQSRYFAILRAHPICVASTGLHGSTGWKLAEYVALAKAVLSEKLVYRATGDLKPGQNYLQFATAEECAAAAVRLVEDGDLRRRLMQNNATYYIHYLRPDVLVGNALKAALALAPVAVPAFT
jgi:hypothetical protein